MMLKSLSIVTFVLGFVILFLVQSATATDPKWREKQQAYFEQIGLKPGDIIDRESSQKVDGLLPPQMLEWLKRGDLTNIRIEDVKYDVSTDDEWTNAGKKNAGKFKLNEVKNLVDAATGKPPLWVYGIPFPGIEIAKDPDGAAKFMYNRMLSTFRGGSLYAPFTLEWIGHKGVERVVKCFWAQYMYWARSDGEVPNQGKYRYSYITGVIKPYDLAGLNQLTYRKMNGTEDDLYVYIPAIRRVKKMSGANRSDPYVGSDVTVDDGGGFAGLTNSMVWRFIEEKIGLICMVEWDTKNVYKLQQLPEGGWRVSGADSPIKLAWEVKGTKGAKWEPVNAVWVPRNFVILEGTPIDPYYNSGKTIYWIDKDTYHTAYKMFDDKAGEYWKTIIFMPRCIEWGEGRRGYHGGGTSGYIVVDDKTRHATGVRVVYVELDTPRLNPRKFTIERLRMVSK